MSDSRNRKRKKIERRRKTDREVEMITYNEIKVMHVPNYLSTLCLPAI
jgi:hypothetical protein